MTELLAVMLLTHLGAAAIGAGFTFLWWCPRSRTGLPPLPVPPTHQYHIVAVNGVEHRVWAVGSGAAARQAVDVTVRVDTNQEHPKEQ